MKKIIILLLLGLFLASCAPARTVIIVVTSTPAPTQQTLPSATPIPPAATPHAQIPLTGGNTGVPNFDHIVLIVLENAGFDTVMGNSTMPNLEALAAKNVLLTNYYAIGHPSLPNYLAMVSGSTQGAKSDCLTCFVSAPNLADEIQQSGRTWKAYMESMPSPCALGEVGKYAQKHNPFIYFDDIRTNTELCDISIVPLPQLDDDLNTNKLPNFAFIMPNLCNSGHSCPAAKADEWVGAMVSKLQGSAALGNNSLIIITFDEADTQDKSACCGSAKGGGKVATILISPLAKPGFQDGTAYSHYSLLKTILAAWNLPDLGKTSKSTVVPFLAPWTGSPAAPAATSTP